jgi:hypothetical protein
MSFMVNRLLPTQPIATAPQTFRQSIASPTIPRALRQFDRGSKYCQSCTWRARTSPARLCNAGETRSGSARHSLTTAGNAPGVNGLRIQRAARHPQEIGGRRHRRHRRPAEDLLRVLSGGPDAMRPAVECDGRVAAADGSALPAAPRVLGEADEGPIPCVHLSVFLAGILCKYCPGIRIARSRSQAPRDRLCP